MSPTSTANAFFEPFWGTVAEGFLGGAKWGSRQGGLVVPRGRDRLLCFFSLLLLQAFDLGPHVANRSPLLTFCMSLLSFPSSQQLSLISTARVPASNESP